MLAQQILNGLVSGSIYALFALGFTLVFGIQKILNIAHAGVFMAGAFIAYYCVIIGLPFWFAMIMAMIACGLVSIIVDFVAFRPLRKKGIPQINAEFAGLVSSLGVDLILINIAQVVSNTRVLSFPFGTFPIQFFRGYGMRISLLQIVILVLVITLVLALIYYLYKTSFGRQIRAVTSNERAAALLGVDAQSVYMQTFFIAGALAGIAGVLIGLSFNSIHFLMGEPYLLYAFVVVVIGGLGSVAGAVVASLALGVTQSLTVAYLSTALSDAIIFSILFIALMFIPNGIFGSVVSATTGGRK